ncbi:MAG: F0F1 ATP synthase subunit delta [Nitrospira sp.]|nr:F0F1 ATP synthase subunit delta [Nitrospira sp.]
MNVELDWSTFVLEIINVLVLVWLLTRFLYRPVMTIIEERKSAIAQTVSEAHAAQQEATALREQYERRLMEWEKEKEQARATFQEELSAERQHKLDDVQAEMEKVREQHAAREIRHLKETVRQAESAAIMHGRQFASVLLGRVAGPELERKLIEAVLEDLQQLTSSQVAAITGSLPASGRGRITTAFPLESRQRELLVRRLGELCVGRLEWEFVEDRELLAGLRVSLGGWVLGGNLRDELKLFGESGANGD